MAVFSWQIWKSLGTRWFKVPFLGWLSDPFKGLSDLQLGGEKGTLNHLVSDIWSQKTCFESHLRWETPCLFGRSNLASGRQVVPRWWLKSGKLKQLRLTVYPIIYRVFIHPRLLGISSINSRLQFWAVWNRILSWEHVGAFRQTSLDELLPVDDCAENYKGRQRQGELETAFLIALISGWSEEKQEHKQK